VVRLGLVGGDRVVLAVGITARPDDAGDEDLRDLVPERPAMSRRNSIERSW
jgi:hypothetical protein